MTMTTMTATLVVEGMKCGACERHVQAALQSAPGVREARVSLPDKLATIDYDPSRLAPDYLIAVVRQAGYAGRIADGATPAAAQARACRCGSAN
jgi:copper chaperone CopZ